MNACKRHLVPVAIRLFVLIAIIAMVVMFSANSAGSTKSIWPDSELVPAFVDQLVVFGSSDVRVNKQPRVEKSGDANQFTPRITPLSSDNDSSYDEQWNRIDGVLWDDPRLIQIIAKTV